MSNPVTRAFFIGRAFAEVLSEKVEDSVTNALSELGKFDAEQREKMRQLAEETLARAEREMNGANASSGTNPQNSSSSSGGDIQETIDDLRAEIASLRSALQTYRNTPA